MCSKSQERVENDTQPFEGSMEYPVAELSLQKPRRHSIKTLTFGMKP